MDHSLLTQTFEPSEVVKIKINVGALLDIPTGNFVEGRYGEYILNGGVATTTGTVGYGNMFKSTFERFQFLTCVARMAGSTGSIYDTEESIEEDHVQTIADRIPEFGGIDVFETKRVTLTGKVKYSGNAWYDVQKEFLARKIKNASKLQVLTPFWNRDHKGPLYIIQPTFTEVDSFTDFETDDVIDMQDKNSLGESGANTLHMRQGLAKLRFLMEAARLNAEAYNYLLMTAHLGKETMMQSAGPGKEIPVRTLTHLKGGDKIMGTTKKFTTNTHNCWHIFNATPLINDGTKGPEYPHDSEDDMRFDTDLNVIKIKNLRGKAGVSGIEIRLIVSQAEGILPSLSEFHYIKEEDRYGFTGGPKDHSYSLELLPDVKLSRTTIRGKIDNDPMLRRALEITSQMCQMDQLWRTMDRDILCTPKELYEDLTKIGFDWKLILSNTRGWWTINNDKHPIPFLSVKDLLRMRKGLYFPYWLNADKKTIKEEFIFEEE